MIKLVRRDLSGPVSARLEQRAAKLAECRRTNEEAPQSILVGYRDPQLKEHLVREANGKCIYCESKITHVYFGDVEHIRPKERFADERLRYENLGLACALCNNAKGDFWDDNTPLLNPYDDDPRTHLLALGFIIARQPGNSDRARITIERLGLNRFALVERRKERIEMLESLADQYMQAPDGAVKDLIRSELCRQAADDGEYAFVVRAYLEAACQLRCGATAA